MPVKPGDVLVIELRPEARVVGLAVHRAVCQAQGHTVGVVKGGVKR